MAAKLEWRRLKNKRRQKEIDAFLEKQTVEYRKRLIEKVRKEKADRIGGKI